MTDVTGFGLAGHGSEMAEGSNLTVVFDTRCFPRVAGIEALANPSHHNKASKANREFLEGRVKVASDADEIGWELAFDAQTSGGLLIAVDPNHVERLIRAWPIEVRRRRPLWDMLRSGEGRSRLFSREHEERGSAESTSPFAQLIGPQRRRGSGRVRAWTDNRSSGEFSTRSGTRRIMSSNPAV